MTEGISVRPAREGDVDEILSVLSAALGESPLLQRTPELFNWKHHDNPFGTSILLVAEEAGSIVGVRAFMRWKLITPKGNEVRCVRAVDTATHPDYQGRGVFRELTMSAVEQARSEGVHLIFNTPNDASGAGYLKMGWAEVGRVRPLVRPRLGRSAGVGPDGITSLRSVIPAAETLTPRNLERPPMGLRTPRSLEYQSWRYLGHPTARYGWVSDEFGGGAVVRSSARRGRTELLVSELLAGTRLIRRLAKSHKARYLAGVFSRGTPERLSAMKAGMFSPPGVPGLRLVARPLTELDVDVSDMASWDLSLGDLELL